ncbi:MAG: hypothetical protein ACK4QP_16715 [Pseudorhizobium sp.]
MKVILRTAWMAVAALQLHTPPAKAERLDPPPQSVMFFGGAMVDENMHEAANVFGADYENNALIGIGYQTLPIRLEPFSFGLEAGIAGRFGSNTTAELWGGFVGRHDGFQLGPVRFSQSFTFGISHVTNSQKGRERDHEEERDGNARTLFYLAPELSLSTETLPDTEVFWRLHHRSGAWGTLGGMHGGSNANVIGIRRKF